MTAPDLALDIIHAVRDGIRDWVDGQTLAQAGLTDRVICVVEQMNYRRLGKPQPHEGATTLSGGEGEAPKERHPIPYSVKTRIGFDSNNISAWIENLLRGKPAVISVHGRTMKQMYKGSASWDAIAAAVSTARGSGTLILGNGDIKSLEQAAQAIQSTAVDGLLIGRASIGNPWLFQSQEPTSAIGKDERIRAALEHASYFVSRRPEGDFNCVRKHLGGYLKGFQDAAAYRDRAVRAKTLNELVTVLS
jgi:tRNA-dihydrouridine synthase